MEIKEKTNNKQRFVNFVGAIAYFVCFFQWIWAVIQYMGLLLPLLEPSGEAPKVVVHESANTATPLIGLAITLIMILISLYVIYKMTLNISKGGKKLVQTTANLAAPLVIKSMHKKVTKKAKLQISAKLKLVIKAILIILPVIVSSFAIFLEKQELDYLIIISVSLILATITIVFFAAEYLLAKLFHIGNQDIW